MNGKQNGKQSAWGMRRFPTVFAFTFRQQTGTRGWRCTTAIAALLLFLIPALLPTLLDLRGSAAEVPEAAAERLDPSTAPECLRVVDTTPGEAAWSLCLPGTEQALPVRPYDDLDSAQRELGRDLLLYVTREDGAYQLSMLYGEAYSDAWADWALATLMEQFPAIQMQKSGLSAEQMAALEAEFAVPVTVETDGADPNAMLVEMLNMVLPYCSILLLYFMVLFYGQGVANSAIMEKTSRLMDTFLVSVQPRAMMLGKVLAVSAAAVLQLGLWLAALLGGIAAGEALLLAVHPASSSGFLSFLTALRGMGGYFDPLGVAVGIALMLSGFLLYCSLAAVGGALASKPEDLSSTNGLFTMALVFSFLICLFGGGLMSGEGVSAGWVDWVPFTAILATPSRLMLGQSPALAGLGSLGLVLLTALLFCALAGKLYQMMSFYRGNPPKPKQLLELWKK